MGTNYSQEQHENKHFMSLMQIKGFQDSMLQRREKFQPEFYKIDYDQDPVYQSPPYNFSCPKKARNSVLKRIKQLKLLNGSTFKKKSLIICTNKIKSTDDESSESLDEAQNMRSERNLLRNFLQDSRPLFLRILKKQVPDQFQSNQNIRSLNMSKSGSKKIYLALLADSRLNEVFSKIFEKKLLEKQYLRSRHSQEIREAYIDNARVFEEAFIDKRFDRIAFKHIQQSQCDQTYSTQPIIQSQQSNEEK